MTEYLHRIAKVEDNKDPNQLGRVRVRIYPEFESLDSQSLPWAEPMLDSDICIPGENVGSFRIPEVGSFVVVRLDSTWQNFLYTGRTPNRDRTDIFTSITDDLKEKADVTVSYPQPLYLLRAKDGTIAYHNTDTGELGIVNSKGVHLLYDSEGNFRMGKKDGFNLVLTSDGKLSFTGGINDSESTLVLFNPLKEILEKLLDHIHIAPNGPTTAAQESGGTPLSVLKSDLSKMESK